MASCIKTANALCFLDETVGGEAGGPVTHAHPTEEGFYVIDGRCAFYAGGKTIDAGPGTFVAIPRYTPHALKVYRLLTVQLRIASMFSSV